MDAIVYSSAFNEDSMHTNDSDSAGQAWEPLDALADRSPNLAKWRSIAIDDQVVPSYVLIGPRTGRVPIRLALLGGIRPSDILSTISIAKLLVKLDLAPLIAQDFRLVRLSTRKSGTGFTKRTRFRLEFLERVVRPGDPLF
jgi:hypothetical protein